MEENQDPNNVKQADFVGNAISKAVGNGAQPKLDINAGLANLALTVVDIQKENKNLVNAIQMLSQSLGQLMEAHNRLAKHVEEKVGGPAPAEPPADTN